MRSNLALAIGGAALLGAGYLLAPREAPSPARPAAALVRPAPAPATALTEADVRRVLRQELAATSPPNSPADAASAGESPSHEREREPARSPAATAALEATRDRIERARATKQWNRDDAAALATTLELLRPAQRDELLSTLVPALNRAEIRLTYPGPIFE